MNKNILKIALPICVSIGILSSSGLIANAASNESTKLVQIALDKKTFYDYNMAYNAIMKLGETYERDVLLARLSSVSEIVWRPDVKKFNAMLDDLVETKGSGKIYDELEAQVTNSSLQEVDKAYLLGELTSWGKSIVYTEDYKFALDKIIKAWNDKKCIEEAENALKQVKNEYSKSYLSDELEKIKIKYNNEKPSGIDWDLTDLLSKPHVDTYVKQVENTNLEAMIQSAINISEGKPVDDRIKSEWLIMPKWGSIASYASHNDVVVNIDSPILLDTNRHGNPVKNFNYYQFRYRVVYWNADIETYQVHYITIGI